MSEKSAPKQVSDDGSVKKPRKRTTRACDQCNHFRTKCDGTNPCGRCVSISITCTYLRAPLKRGKASESYKKSLLEKAGQAASTNRPKSRISSSGSNITNGSDNNLQTANPLGPGSAAINGHHDASSVATTSGIHNKDIYYAGEDVIPEKISVIDGDSESPESNPKPDLPSYLIYSKYPTITAETGLPLSPAASQGSGPGHANGHTNGHANNGNGHNGTSGSRKRPNSMAYGDESHKNDNTLPTNEPHAKAPSLTQIMESPVQSDSAWKYPSISAISEHLDDILTQELAEQYFEEYLNSPKSDNSPLFQIIRKEKLLLPSNDAVYDSSSSSPSSNSENEILKRGKTLALALVWKSCMESPTIDPLLSRTLSATFENILLIEFVLPKTLDDVIALIEVGTIYASANCRTVAVRLWKQAIALGLQLQINVKAPGSRISAEKMEERRRTWWYLYIMDMHIAFLYGTLPIIPEKETEKIQMPCSDDNWRSNEYFRSLDSRGGFSASRGGVELAPAELQYLPCFVPISAVMSSMITARAMSSQPRLRVDRTVLSSWSKIIQTDINAVEIGLSNASPNSSLKSRNYLKYTEFALYTLSPFVEQPWDPLSMFSLNKLSHDMEERVYHYTIAASRALAEVLELDPQLEGFPPFFSVFIYVHSFLLLMIDPSRDKTDGHNEFATALQTAARLHDQCILKFKVEFLKQLRHALQGWVILGEESVLLRKKLLHSFEISRNSHDILF